MSSSQADDFNTEQCAFFEALLNKQINEKSISRVIKVDIKDALPVGDNYSSMIARATLTVVLRSGDTTKKTVIVKKAHVNEEKRDALKEMNTFKIETKVYSDILKKCEMLLDEYQDTSDKLWGDMIGYKPYNMIVLEDLKAQNYSLVDRKKMLDKNHTSLVMHGLGRFHALGYALLQRGLLSKDDTPLYFPLIGAESINNLYRFGLRGLSDVIQKHWGPEWKEIGQKLAKQPEVVMEKIKKLYETQEDSFVTLCHGDCWSTNIMFKYCPYDDSIPIALKFIDFQAVHVDSYIFDLVNILYMSVHPEVRQKNYTELLTIYQKTLQKTLAMYGYEDKVPDLSHIIAEAERVEYYSLLVHVLFFPFAITDIEDAFKMEYLADSSGAEKAYNPEVYNQEKFKTFVQPMLKKWNEKGLF